MSQPMGSTEELVQVSARELEALRANSARWGFYAARVAAHAGVSVEQMEKEVDEAIAGGLLPLPLENGGPL